MAASGQGGVEAVYADENVWLTQKMMGVLFDVDVRTISYHLKNVFAEHELEAGSVIRNIRITAADGKTYDTGHYKLSAIIAVHELAENSVIQFFRITATGGRRIMSLNESIVEDAAPNHGFARFRNSAA